MSPKRANIGIVSGCICMTRPNGIDHACMLSGALAPRCWRAVPSMLSFSSTRAHPPRWNSAQRAIRGTHGGQAFGAISWALIFDRLVGSPLWGPRQSVPYCSHVLGARSLAIVSAAAAAHKTAAAVRPVQCTLPCGVQWLTARTLWPPGVSGHSLVALVR